jgi:aminopeptidase N
MPENLTLTSNLIPRGMIFRERHIGLLFLLLSLTVSLSHAQEQFCGRKNSFAFSSVSPSYSPLEDLYDVTFYFIDLHATNASTFISGNTQLLLTALSDIDTLAIELADELQIDSIHVNDRRENAVFRSGNLVKIHLPLKIQKDQLGRVQIFYHGSPSQAGFFTGLSRGRDFFYQQYVSYTLSEPFQASDWFPCKQNLTDKADSVRVHITLPNNLMAGSNGQLTKRVELPGNFQRFEWKSEYPIAYYLISFAVADYIDYSFKVQIPGIADSLLVQNFIYNHPQIFTREKEKIDATAGLLEYFSEIYGPYPFHEDKYGHCMAPMGGGMEHQTMTTLQNFNFELVAHELAHQWFGDHVTCKTWQDIWINEGFASYSEFLALEHFYGTAEAGRWLSDAHSKAIAYPDGSVYLTENEARNESRIFNNGLSYKKGAAILHMLRWELNNDSIFFAAIKKFQQTYSHNTATAYHFLSVINEVSGTSFNWFFDQWYYGKGYPVLDVAWRIAEGIVKINLNQHGSSTSTPVFKLSLDVKFVFANGQDTVLTLTVDKPAGEWELVFNRAVKEIQVDPEGKVLMKASVYQLFPGNSYFQVAPNPFSGKLSLFLSRPDDVSILSLTNTSGKTIMRKELTGWSDDMDLTGLPAGVYVLSLTSPEGPVYSTRIIKTNSNNP